MGIYVKKWLNGGGEAFLNIANQMNLYGIYQIRC